MNITYTDYLELSAPLDVACAALCDPVTWDALPTGMKRLGELWSDGRELYNTSFNYHAANQEIVLNRMCVLRLNAVPVAVAGPYVQIEIALHDAVISSHAIVHLTLTGLRSTWPWQRRRLRRRMAVLIRACHATLQTILSDQMLARAPQETLVTSIATSATVVAPTAAEVGAATGSALFGTGPTSDTPVLVFPLAESLADRLRPRYPLTVKHFEAMGALDHLERVHRLEQGWQQIMRGQYDRTGYVLTERLERGDWSVATGIQQRARQNPKLAPDSELVEAEGAKPHRREYDLIYAGGGLGLLHAAVMAKCYGRRVLLFDRGEVGCAHREWNISRRELQAMVDLGLVSWEELADVVMREYRDGVVRFHASAYDESGPPRRQPVELWLPEVLNVALDAGALLRLMRRKLEAAGGTVLSCRGFRKVRVSKEGPLQVEVELVPIGHSADPSYSIETYRARLLLDGMGSTSPLALLRHAGRPFAGVCPTVGSVARGFAPGNSPQEHDPTIGDILISVADAQSGQQLMWEGFPGRDDELTVYLFYYATIQTHRGLQTGIEKTASPISNPLAGFPSTSSGTGARQAPPASDSTSYSLLELFEQYFSLLPTYKRPGPDFEHIKPVYGYIPARHSLRRSEAPLLRGVLPVGDSAAQQSPLTFCGFGSHVRNLHRTTSLLDFALRHELLEPQHLRRINAFQVNVSLNWVFSRFMQPWNHPHDVNKLQNLFLESLHELGTELATRFFQDRMRWSDYHRMLLGVLKRYHTILPISFKVLGAQGIYQWAGDYLRFSVVAVVAAAAQRAGAGVERALCIIAGRCAPALGLRVRARYAEWRAMGWV